MPFIPELLITETGAWNVSHRVNSALPGYLIISSKTPAKDLSELPQDALRELGPLLATAQMALRQQLGARLVYIGRYGHVPDQPFHFHIVPVYQWVEELFCKTADTGRYSSLRKRIVRQQLMAPN